MATPRKSVRGLTRRARRYLCFMAKLPLAVKHSFAELNNAIGSHRKDTGDIESLVVRGYVSKSLLTLPTQISGYGIEMPVYAVTRSGKHAYKKLQIRTHIYFTELRVTKPKKILQKNKITSLKDEILGVVDGKVVPVVRRKRKKRPSVARPLPKGMKRCPRNWLKPKPYAPRKSVTPQSTLPSSESNGS